MTNVFTNNVEINKLVAKFDRDSNTFIVLIGRVPALEFSGDGVNRVRCMKAFAKNRSWFHKQILNVLNVPNYVVPNPFQPQEA